MSYKNIKVEVKNGIGWITISRPEALNALDTATVTELTSVFRSLGGAEPGGMESVKVVVLTGEGKAFAAGADISQMRGLDGPRGREMAIAGLTLTQAIENLDQPVIAAVNGYALGGGLELAMSCDIRIASERAKFGQPEVNLGIIPGHGGTQRLPRLVGKGMAKYLILTGESISAQEAKEMGLVEQVAAPEALLEEAERIARVIMTKAPIAVKLAKRAINNGLNMDLGSAMAYEAEAYTTTFCTEDRVEGMGAFLEKRAAVFKNK